MPKVSTGFAFAVLMVVAAFVGGLIWMAGRESADYPVPQPPIAAQPAPKKPVPPTSVPTPVTNAPTKNSLELPLQSLNGNMLGSVSFDLPGGWGKTGERVASENTDAPKTIEQKYAGQEGELILTNLYQGGACMTEGGYVTVKSPSVTFSVCYSSAAAGTVLFNSVNIAGTNETDISGSIRFKAGLNAANQRSFVENFLKTATKGMDEGTVGSSPQALPTICPQDAKSCPDGSYVIRTSPKCEFAPCK